MLKTLLRFAAAVSIATGSLNAFYLPPFVVPGDVDYAIIKTAPQEVIYDPAQSGDAEDFLSKSLALHHDYEKSFSFSLTQTNYTGLASHRNQIANGYATFLPLLMNGLYGGGAAHIDYFGSLSWLDMLLIHEFAHTYQLDAKSDVSRTLQYVLGNTGAWFVNPNYLLPTLFLEGNAVMNESRYGIGGRLYVGEHRALVYALSQSGKLDYTRLLNNHLSFPYTREKYLVGGYFWAYIAQRFGVGQANSYFKQHATHYINPLRINRSFTEHFGISYRTAVDDFLKRLQVQSAGMKLLEGEAIAHAYFIASLNADRNSIYWMQSQEKGCNQQAVYTKSGQFKLESTSLLIDKLFRQDGKFYTASQAKVHASMITSGLFDAKLNLLPGSENFLMLDARARHRASFYIPDSYRSAKLYKERQYIGRADSSAILDENGNIYYVRQEGKTRRLLRNSEPIASWKGYSQKLLEVQGNKVYFIAPTPFGSSLYYAQGGKIFRLSSADNIVDARLIDATHFLAVTVDAQSYHVMKAALEKPVPVKPAWYEYTFDTQTLQAATVDAHLKKELYTPVKNMHYGGLSRLSLGYNSYHGYIGSAELLFTDPMQQNQLTVGGSYLGYYNDASLRYENRKSLLQYALFAAYNYMENYIDSDNTIRNWEQGRIGGALIYPFFQKQRESLRGEIRSQSEWEKGIANFAVQTALYYRYAERYSLGYDWHKLTRFQIGYKSEAAGDSYALTYHHKGETLPGLFLSTTLAYSYSDDYVLLYNWELTQYANETTQILSGYSSQLWFYTSEAGKLNGEVSYAFKSGLYFDIWPFSLRRTALLAGVNYIAAAGSDTVYGVTGSVGRDPLQYYEARVGVDLEILSFHIYAGSHLQLTANYNSYLDDIEYNVGIGIRY